MPIFGGNRQTQLCGRRRERILYSVAQNFKVAITTVEDAFGTLFNTPVPELRMLWEQYGISVAKIRRSGNMSAH